MEPSLGVGVVHPTSAPSPIPAAVDARLAVLESEVAHQGVVIDMLIETLLRITAREKLAEAAS
jgi:hypothetical protein